MRLCLVSLNIQRQKKNYHISIKISETLIKIRKCKLTVETL